jgi:hypothetical protein
MTVPTVAQAQVILDKGGPKEIFLVIKPAPNGGSVLDNRDDRHPKASHNLRRVISELKFQDNEPYVLVLLTTEEEIQFVIKSPGTPSLITSSY